MSSVIEKTEQPTVTIHDGIVSVCHHAALREGEGVRHFPICSGAMYLEATDDLPIVLYVGTLDGCPYTALRDQYRKQASAWTNVVVVETSSKSRRIHAIRPIRGMLPARYVVQEAAA